MIPEIGSFALILALLLSALQGTLPIAGAHRRNPAWMSLARPLAQGQLMFIALAFGCLVWSFVHNDFSVVNVATNSNSELPVRYRVAASWGSHEGSMLLWVGYRLFDWLTPGDAHAKIFEEGNRAVAILAGSFVLGLALIIAAAIHG